MGLDICGSLHTLNGPNFTQLHAQGLCVLSCLHTHLLFQGNHWETVFVSSLSSLCLNASLIPFVSWNKGMHEAEGFLGEQISVKPFVNEVEFNSFFFSSPCGLDEDEDEAEDKCLGTPL